MEENDQIIQPNEREQPTKEIVSPRNNEWLEWIKSIAITAIIVIAIRYFLFTLFIVVGTSMEPNFHTGQRVIVNKIVYKLLSEPKPGEVIVLSNPEKKQDLIKRVIACAGDTIECRGDNVRVNGKKIEEPYIREAVREAHRKNLLYNNLDDFPNDSTQPYKVPEGHVFVLGDNRTYTADSRDDTVGPVPSENIIGRVECIIWPLPDIKLIQSL